MVKGRSLGDMIYESLQKYSQQKDIHELQSIQETHEEQECQFDFGADIPEMNSNNNDLRNINISSPSNSLPQWFNVRWSVCLWDEHPSVMVSLMNVTQQVNYQIELKKMDAYKDDLLSTVSHELKTPLGLVSASY